MQQEIIDKIKDTIINNGIPKPTRVLIQDKNREAKMYDLLNEDDKNLDRVINLVLSIQPAYIQHQIACNKEAHLPNLGSFKPRRHSKSIKLKVAELKANNVPTSEYPVILREYATKLRLQSSDDYINNNVLNSFKKSLNK